MAEFEEKGSNSWLGQQAYIKSSKGKRIVIPVIPDPNKPIVDLSKLPEGVEENDEEPSETPATDTGAAEADEVDGGDEPATGSVALGNLAQIGTFFEYLAKERAAIHANDSLSAKEKKSLLNENRKTIIVATGGTIKKTDNVVYGILLFGGSVIVILALLTVFKDLPSDILLTFVGTVLGGTIATIAQKLGKI